MEANVNQNPIKSEVRLINFGPVIKALAGLNNLDKTHPSGSRYPSRPSVKCEMRNLEPDSSERVAFNNGQKVNKMGYHRRVASLPGSFVQFRLFYVSHGKQCAHYLTSAA